MESDVSSLFVSTSVKQLQRMLAYIESCLERLTDDQVWSRGAPNENSIGNLIAHLCGNVRQWICAGIGGEPDNRDRDSEFSTTGGLSIAELSARLKQTVADAIKIIEGLSAQRLVLVINPQDGPVSVLEAVYHVVGHFQQHTGQIIFATKILGGQDLGLYRP